MTDIQAVIPPLPGSYALWWQLPGSLHLSIGRLGSFPFPAGDYLYLGSAFGSGGLLARLRHHVRIHSKPHWHLDALRPHMILLGGWYCTGASGLECTWSQALAGMPGVCAPVPKFGAADCRSGCTAHLLALPADIGQAGVQTGLQAVVPDLRVIHFGALEIG